MLKYPKAPNITMPKQKKNKIFWHYSLLFVILIFVLSVENIIWTMNHGDNDSIIITTKKEDQAPLQLFKYNNKPTLDIVLNQTNIPNKKIQPAKLKPTTTTTTIKSTPTSSSIPTTIAYAISLTSCGRNDILLDPAAVLKYSIDKVSLSSKYNYTTYAFVHPDAANCTLLLQKLGYITQIRDTPFNISDIHNKWLPQALERGCCGPKEYIKLYSYLLVDHAIVVHLDLDTMLLKPLDDIFDLMLDSTLFNKSKIPFMWKQKHDKNNHYYHIPNQIDFMFTRDYAMVPAGTKQPHQVGVQGGFLVIRPNISDFERYLSIIKSTTYNFDSKNGWGGRKLGHGGYFGAAQIQGLASYYYGHVQPNRSVELNRCYYNNMYDEPRDTTDKKNNKCRTLETNCQDCRLMDINNVYSVHFTHCLKPWKCRVPNIYLQNKKENDNIHNNDAHNDINNNYYNNTNLCFQLQQEWYKIKILVEASWQQEGLSFTKNNVLASWRHVDANYSLLFSNFHNENLLKTTTTTDQSRQHQQQQQQEVQFKIDQTIIQKNCKGIGMPNYIRMNFTRLFSYK